MVPDTPEQWCDTNVVSESTNFENEITCILQTPQTETKTQISCDTFYTSCSNARKLNFDEIKNLGKIYYL